MKTLKAIQNDLANPLVQLQFLEKSISQLPSFGEKLADASLYPLRARGIEILQVNVGKMCNQTCTHCHVDAGPDRKEIMTRETMKECLSAISSSQIETVDIIVSSTGSSELILRSDDVRPLMKVRKNRPLFFIDIAVPRDLDPELNEIENVFLYDIDDLSQVVQMNRSEREKEAVKAERIVEEETLKFAQWQDGLTITPTISALRKKADRICSSEVSRTLARMNLSDSERQKVEKLAQSITAKMLHDPLQFLKSESCRKGDDSKIDMVRTVFGLENDDPDN